MKPRWRVLIYGMGALFLGESIGNQHPWWLPLLAGALVGGLSVPVARWARSFKDAA